MKRTPLKRKSGLKSSGKGIGRTKRQAAKDVWYRKMIAGKGAQSSCDGCELVLPLTNSHLIPRSRRSDLTSDPNNVHRHCHRCHDLCETGLWEALMDGEEIARYVRGADAEFYQLKSMKFERRTNQTIDEYYGFDH